jgi:hypothetical protein
MRTFPRKSLPSSDMGAKRRGVSKGVDGEVTLSAGVGGGGDSRAARGHVCSLPSPRGAVLGTLF